MLCGGKSSSEMPCRASRRRVLTAACPEALEKKRCPSAPARMERRQLRGPSEGTLSLQVRLYSPTPVEPDVAVGADDIAATSAAALTGAVMRYSDLWVETGEGGLNWTRVCG